MSEISASQLTAVATFALAILALITAVFAGLAFRKQSQEVRAIERQVTDQQEVTRQQAELLRVQAGQLELQRQQFEQEQADRRQAQASLVYMSVEPRPFDGSPQEMRDAACVYNTSAQPIYDVVLVLDGRPDQRQPVLLPGRTCDWRGLGAAFASGQRPAWITFRDSAGVRWLRHPNGRLAEEPAQQ